ncbi:TIGR02996 domain-containing protein [Thalassoroseus pseudoceratinae]|uniref:TIGR02996 domain-containing protein n=1 Tax=Thalassoroseus pseudoceratinae TaxID=2713176 RepID=UPI00141DF33D|nr:TIGR02996 domain-containing protein [Thalassoroseus pseudoceratinae]
MPQSSAPFLQAIVDDPYNDTPRLIYADWLDAQGQSSRAEFIRLQCESARLRKGSSRRQALELRADELLFEHESEWLGEKSEQIVRWKFRRGFLHSATMTANAFLKHGESVFQTEPLWRIGFVDDDGEPLQTDALNEVVSHPTFGAVRSLDIIGAAPVFEPHWHSQWSEPQVPLADWLHALAQATHVRNLKSFVPGTWLRLFNPFGEETGTAASALETFCQAEHLRTLRRLSLNGCPMAPARQSDQLAELVANASFARQLKRLNLENCRLNDTAAQTLASSTNLRGLTQLTLFGNSLTQSGWEALFQSPHLKQIRDVDVFGADLPVFAKSPLTNQLRDLTLGWSDESGTPEVEAAWYKLIKTARPPRRLHLICQEINSEIIETMATSGWLRNLRSLYIDNDSQSEGFFHPETITELLRSNAAPNLVELRTHEFADQKFVQSLGDWDGQRRLESLDLSDDYYGRGTAKDVFEPSNLSPNLRELKGFRIQTQDDVNSVLRSKAVLTHAAFCITGDLTETQTRAIYESRLLRHVEFLRLSFLISYGEQGNISDETVRNCLRPLALPQVLPRLRAFRTYVFGDDPPELDAVKRRLGPRMKS